MNRHILLFMVLLCLTLFLFNLMTVAEPKQSSVKIEVPSFQQSEESLYGGLVYSAEVNFIENAPTGN